MEPHVRHHHMTVKLKRLIGYVIAGSLLTIALIICSLAILNMKLENDSAASRKEAIVQFNKILTDNSFKLPEGSSHAPYKIEDSTLIDVIAKNQPAVVRVVTLTCADMTVRSKNATISLKDACAGMSGSGSIISSNGYIATSGHVVVLSPKSLLMSTLTSTANQITYVNFLVQGGLLSSTSAQTIRNAIAANDPSLQAQIEATKDFLKDDMFSIQNQESTYSVQLANHQVQLMLQGNRTAIRPSDGVVLASLIAKDYDINTSSRGLTTGIFTSSDVALLKVEGTYPYIELGDINTLSIGDRLTAIGFPSLLNNANSSSTDDEVVPSITQGSLLQIVQDAPKNGRSILSTNIPISQGSSGGPALDVIGHQVGIGTYALLNCTSGQETCFGDGQLRDIADIKRLISQNSLVLEKKDTNRAWSDILALYQRGEYIQTVQQIRNLLNTYPDHYLARALESIASQQIGERYDTSAKVETGKIMTSTLLFGTAGAGLLVSVLVLVFMHYSILHAHSSLRYYRSQKQMTAPHK